MNTNGYQEGGDLPANHANGLHPLRHSNSVIRVYSRDSRAANSLFCDYSFLIFGFVSKFDIRISGFLRAWSLLTGTEAKN
jgi:hypothetical protein